MSHDGPTFGRRCAQELREFRRNNPTMSPEEFWKKLADVVDMNLALLPTEGRPRISKKEIQTALFKALVEACGYVAEEMSTDAQRVASVALAHIRQVTPDVTRDVFASRARGYRKKYPGVALTPKALANHWHEFGASERTLSAKRDVYCEPVGWRETAARLFPNADFSDREWADIRVTFGAQILAQMQ